MSTWRMYAWSLVALMAIAILCSGCSLLPRPAIPTTLLPPNLSTTLPEGTGPDEAASYYRKQATFFKAQAENAEAEAKKNKLEARQAWLWWAGVAAIVAGAIAFVLSYAYPLAAFLRIGGWAALGGGVSMLLVGEALPYIGLFSLLAIIAIAASLVLNTRVLANLTQSWKSASEALPSVLRKGLDETSLKRQGALVRPYIDKLLKKGSP